MTADPPPPYSTEEGRANGVAGELASGAVGPTVGLTVATGYSSAAEATTGQTVLTGGLWHGLSLLLPQLYTVVISVAAARILGPDDLGRQSFIAFVQISAVMLVSGGLAKAVARFSGEAMGRGRPDVLWSLVRWAWSVTLAAGTLGGLMLVAFAAARPELRSAWLLAAVVVLLGALHAIPTAVLIGIQQWRAATVAGVVTGTVGLVAMVTVLAAGGGIVGMFAVEAVVAAINLAWLGSLARRTIRSMASCAGPAGGFRRSMARYAAVTSVDVLFGYVVWSRTEFFFLERYRGPAEVAVYSVAFAAVLALTKVPEIMVATFSPAVATLYGAGADARIQSGFARALRLVTAVSLPMTALAVALGPATIEVIYGREYRPVGVVLVAMMCIFPIVAVGRMSGSLLAGLGVAAFPLLASVAATGVNIGLDLALIDPYGALGAAVANGAAQLITSLAMVTYACRRVGGVCWHWTRLVCSAVASLLAGLSAWASWSFFEGLLGLAAGGTVGAAVLVALAGVMPIISQEDLEWLEETAGRRLGGFVGVACRWVRRRPASRSTNGAAT